MWCAFFFQVSLEILVGLRRSTKREEDENEQEKKKRSEVNFLRSMITSSFSLLFSSHSFYSSFFLNCFSTKPLTTMLSFSFLFYLVLLQGAKLLVTQSSIFLTKIKS
jgi:hypothetical protein